jgi:multidrug efflux pump subunit AcrA (membrane-fusion protein)
MQVPAAKVAETELVDATEYLAQLRSRRDPAIKPQVEGQITAIFVKPGDVVDAGAPLMRIDPARSRRRSRRPRRRRRRAGRRSSSRSATSSESPSWSPRARCPGRSSTTRAPPR